MAEVAGEPETAAVLEGVCVSLAMVGTGGSPEAPVLSLPNPPPLGSLQRWVPLACWKFVLFHF